MIDYVFVIYGNYELYELQIANFKKRLPRKDYNLIVVDNTLDKLKQNIKADPIVDKFLPIPSKLDFDGVSHGKAYDYGISHCESDIICPHHSDFFVLDENMHSYIYDKFENGYKAVGPEFNDGEYTKKWTERFPYIYENLPCSYGSYFAKKVAKSDTWIITSEELDENQLNGYIDTGWRVSKYIIDHGLKTFSWRTDAEKYGNCFFTNEYGKIACMHYTAGCRARKTTYMKKEIFDVLDRSYL